MVLLVEPEAVQRLKNLSNLKLSKRKLETCRRYKRTERIAVKHMLEKSGRRIELRALFATMPFA